ncbi:unnamed protein product [Sphagnum jensenii]|uniref:Uncharacterized protein n=1 Tax=Sphagnum jensenii TaxID=128206 RepID=A0ABP1AJR9_9BRYO
MKTSSERVTIALVLSTRHSRFGCSCFAETRNILDLRFQIPDLFLQVSSQQHFPGQQCSIIAREAHSAIKLRCTFKAALKLSFCTIQSPSSAATAGSWGCHFLAVQFIKLAERAVGFVARLISQLVGHEGNGCLKQGLRFLGRVQLMSEGQIGA